MTREIERVCVKENLNSCLCETLRKINNSQARYLGLSLQQRERSRIVIKPPHHCSTWLPRLVKQFIINTAQAKTFSPPSMWYDNSRWATSWWLSVACPGGRGIILNGSVLYGCLITPSLLVEQTPGSPPFRSRPLISCYRERERDRVGKSWVPRQATAELKPVKVNYAGDEFQERGAMGEIKAWHLRWQTACLCEGIIL